jgi:hypothetical protein
MKSGNTSMKNAIIRKPATFARCLSALPALVVAGVLSLPAQTVCPWDSDANGDWTDSIDQFGPDIDSDWDCPGIPPLLEINFPHNFSPAGPFFAAEIGGGVTVTVLPLLPIAVSNLTLTDGSSVALIDGSNFLLQNTGGAGNVTSDGEITLDNFFGALSTNVSLDGLCTFGGGGKVVLGGPGTAVSGNFAYNPSSTLVIADHIFEGAGALGGESLSFRNQATGIIRANVPLAELEIDPGNDNNIINEGLMEATGGGILRLKQTAISNAGGIVRAGGASQVLLQEITLSNGTLEGGGVIRGVSGVTLEGPLTNSGTYVVANGATTQLDGTFTNSGQVVIDGGSFLAKTPSTMIGGGSVTLAVVPGATSVLGAVFNSGATLENTDNLIEGGGSVLVPLTNHGTIRANEPGSGMWIGRDVTNDSLMEATDGGILGIGDGFANTAVANAGGQVHAKSGNVLVQSGGSVTGGMVTVDAGARLQFSNGSVTGGTVTNTAGGVIEAVQFSTNRLSGAVTNPAGAAIELADDHGLILDGSGTYQNGGVIRLLGTGPYAGFANTALLLDGTVTLQGGGVVELANSSSNVIRTWSGNSGVLVNQDHTIRGAGQIGRNVTTLVNHDLIRANLPPSAELGSGILSIDPGPGGMSNDGTLRASNGGTLELRDGEYANAGGVIEAWSDSAVILIQGTHVTGGLLDASAGGVIEMRNSDILCNGSGPGGIAFDGCVEITTAGNVQLTGTLSNSGILRLSGNGRARIEGPVTLTGGGEVHLDGSSTRLINSPDGLPGDTLINVDNRISGTGVIQFLAIENGGTLAPGNSPGTLATGALTQTASGMLEIELAGAAPGQFDVLQVSGTATLGGTLRVLALPGMVAPAGSTFTILTSGGISGSFATVELPLNGLGQPLFSLAQVGTSLRLTALENVAVPLPFAEWAAGQGLDESNNATGLDPNGDGLDNLAAYALGVPALGPTTGSGIALAPAPGGGFTLDFSVPATVTDVTIGSEISANLAAWSPGPAPVVVQTDFDRIHYQLIVPPTGPSRFARLIFQMDSL